MISSRTSTLRSPNRPLSGKHGGQHCTAFGVALVVCLSTAVCSDSSSIMGQSVAPGAADAACSDTSIITAGAGVEGESPPSGSTEPVRPHQGPAVHPQYTGPDLQQTPEAPITSVRNHERI